MNPALSPVTAATHPGEVDEGQPEVTFLRQPRRGEQHRLGGHRDADVVDQQAPEEHRIAMMLEPLEHPLRDVAVLQHVITALQACCGDGSPRA